MTATKQVKIYLEAPLHRALRLKSAETDFSIFELVNVFRHPVAEDADDLAAFRDRAKEPRIVSRRRPRSTEA